jgi:integrase/recombinase XerC
MREPSRRVQRSLQLAIRQADQGSPRQDQARSDEAIVTLLLHCGLRVAELVALRRDDIRLSQRKGTIRVRAGKGRKQRLLHLNAEAHKAARFLLDPGPERAELLQGQRGPMGVRAIQLMLARYGRAAGLGKLSPHTLRHCFCRRLAEAGVKLEEIAALAGHEKLETTRIYVEPGQDDLGAALDKLAGSED